MLFCRSVVQLRQGDAQHTESDCMLLMAMCSRVAGWPCCCPCVRGKRHYFAGSLRGVNRDGGAQHIARERRNEKQGYRVEVQSHLRVTRVCAVKRGMVFLLEIIEFHLSVFMRES